ncbi:MAG: hypothetical protein R3B91_06415 [Planctomycetaceae bacterium]
MSTSPFSELIALTREVSPTRENAERLYHCYQEAYVNDDELYRRIVDSVSDPELGIDGLTEPMTVDDFERLISREGVLTLEVADPVADTRPPGGFVAVSYCTREPESIHRFRDNFLGANIEMSELVYASEEDDAWFHQFLDAGNIGCYSEFVSIHDPRVTLALRISSHQRVCIERMGRSNCGIVGKCLDEARIGASCNPHGNRPIKRQAVDTGLRPIAHTWQQRTLSLSPHAQLAEEATLDTWSSVTAELKFSLFVGGTEKLTSEIARKLAQARFNNPSE